MQSAMAALALMVSLGGAKKVEERAVTKAAVYLVKRPSFLAPRASGAPVVRGDKIKVEIPDEQGWFSATKAKGFIHRTYLSDRPVAFQITHRDVKGEGLVSGNYNLAVGGFTEDTEKAYRSSHKDYEKGFAWLEACMPAGRGAERAEPRSPEELAKFATDGKLTVHEGAK